MVLADSPSCALRAGRAASWSMRTASAPDGVARIQPSHFSGLRPRPGNDLVASALRGAEPIETLFLLVAERAVKLLERGLHGLHRAQHCIEPLLHRLQAADRGERSIRGALRAQQIGLLV